MNGSASVIMHTYIMHYTVPANGDKSSISFSVMGPTPECITLTCSCLGGHEFSIPIIASTVPATSPTRRSLVCRLYNNNVRTLLHYVHFMLHSL